MSRALQSQPARLSGLASPARPSQPCQGVPCAPVLTRSEILRHPQVLANGIMVEVDHPVAGRLRQARPAARFSDTPPSIRVLLARCLRKDRRQRLGDAGAVRIEIEEALVSPAPQGAISAGRSISR